MTIGYDKYTLNHQLLLDLPMEEGVGILTHDRAKPYHPVTLNGVPAWTQLANGIVVLDFDPTGPDYLSCPAGNTADLDFTTEDFSLAIWANCFPAAITSHDFFSRGVLNTDGWIFGIWWLDAICFDTYQLGEYQTTYGEANSITPGVWTLAGMTRSGANAVTYKDGRDITAFPGIHIDPATANRELRIGLSNTGVCEYKGYLYRPRIWGRALAAWEWERLFNLERDYFGV